jgi:hypothetical protein
MRKSKGKSVIIKVDFKGVEAGGVRTLPDGNYLVVVHSVEKAEGKESGNTYLAWQFKVKDKKHKGVLVFDNTSLQPQALFRLRALLEAIGEDISETKAMSIDCGELIGKELKIEVINEKYQGKSTPKVASYDSADSGKTTDKDDNEEDDDSEDDDSDAESEESDDEDAEDADDEDEKDEPIKKIVKGTKVKFAGEKGRIRRGTVVRIKGKTAYVDVNGDEHDVALDELTVL